jgi:DNA-directed RNA polymerase specialized sigma24 family protein
MSKGVPTQVGFDKLLGWLGSDRDTAAQKYAGIQLRLIRIFSSRGCSDAEDLSDKTFNVVVSKIDWLIENYIGDPALYFYGVAKNVYREDVKPKPTPVRPPPPPEPAELEEACGQLDECLDELSAVDRDVVLRYQEGEKGKKIKNRKKLAEELKISRNGLRIRVCHIHTRLRECIERLQRAASRQ